MAGLAARVAAAVGGTTADAKSRAVGLDVAKTLAVVALLSCASCKHSSSIPWLFRIVTYSQWSSDEGRCCSRGLRESARASGKNVDTELTRLLAVVAKALAARADLGVVANVATLVACTTGEGRHLDIRF